jgi:ATP-dependent Clp protease ATP-binding subunit ClpB
MIVFRPLTQNEIKGIVSIQLEALKKRLADRRIELTVTDDALSSLAIKGFDPIYGARPLKRAIQSELVNPLSTLLLRGEVKEGQSVSVTVEHDEFQFKIQEPA